MTAEFTDVEAVTKGTFPTPPSTLTLNKSTIVSRLKALTMPQCILVVVAADLAKSGQRTTQAKS